MASEELLQELLQVKNHDKNCGKQGTVASIASAEIAKHQITKVGEQSPAICQFVLLINCLSINRIHVPIGITLSRGLYQGNSIAVTLSIAFYRSDSIAIDYRGDAMVRRGALHGATVG